MSIRQHPQYPSAAPALESFVLLTGAAFIPYISLGLFGVSHTWRVIAAAITGVSACVWLFWDLRPRSASRSSSNGLDSDDESEA